MSRCVVLHNLWSDVQRIEKTRSRGLREKFRLMLNKKSDLITSFFSWLHGKQHYENYGKTSSMHICHIYILKHVFMNIWTFMNIIHTYVYIQIFKYVISLMIFSTVQKKCTSKSVWKSFTELFLKKYLKEKWKASLRKLFVKGINSILIGYCDG